MSTDASFDQLEPMLRQAVQALDEAAKRLADAPEQLPRDAVRLAQAVSTARRTLYAELIRQGWLPPDRVPRGIDLDERLVTEGLGKAYDADVPGE